MSSLLRLSGGRRLLLALVLGGALFAIASAVQASIPDSSGVIHACYKNVNGQLRAIDTGSDQTCNPGESPLNWNQTEPTGATGATGPTGATGATGPTGADGVSVTSAQLPTGDANCPNGGSSFTSASGITYACNGANGGGLSSINDLNGTACGRGPDTGTIVVSYSNSGTVTLECDVTQGETNLAVPSNPGDTNIKVADVFGMKPGQTIVVDTTGANPETRIILSVGTAGPLGTGVSLSGPLAVAHNSGATVTFHT